MKSLSVAEIAQILAAEIVGNKDARICAVKPLNESSSMDISFFAPTSKKQHAELFEIAKNSNAAAILTHKKYDEIKTTQLIVANPLLALSTVAKALYSKPTPKLGIHQTAVIEESAKLAKDARIGAFCYIGNNVELAENVVIHPHVTIYDNVKIGKDCTIHAAAVIREDVIIGDSCVIQAGAIIGGDGFGYVTSENGFEHIPHIGTVVLENQVEIGSNSTIDRATLGKTNIGHGSKIDNLVMIGHNVQTGKNCILCGQVGVSGSSQLGDNVTLGGQSGVADHVKVGSYVRVAAQSGVTSSVKDKQDVAGMPAIPAQDWRRAVSVFRKLPEIYRLIKNK